MNFQLTFDTLLYDICLAIGIFIVYTTLMSIFNMPLVSECYGLERILMISKREACTIVSHIVINRKEAYQYMYIILFFPIRTCTLYNVTVGLLTLRKYSILRFLFSQFMSALGNTTNDLSIYRRERSIKKYLTFFDQKENI